MENYNEIFNHLWSHAENEIVEFKKAENNFDFDDLGKYFSALSNEASLRQRDAAWMIFGVWDKTHEIIGTSFKNSEVALNKLKHDLAQHTSDGSTFREIVTITVEGKRVLLFNIPASPRNIVMHWKGIAYGRNGESLTPLSQAKQDEIRQQSPLPDWTAELVSTATIADLDEMALAKARIMYKKVHSSKIPSEEIDAWSVEELLSHSEIMREGKLTRAAILLLGKENSLVKLHPAVAQITWTLQNEEDEVVDYEHFSIPFILTVDAVLAKIRNLTMRELPGGTLFPDVEKQYDDYSIREALHNCIAHQDYTLRERITFVEGPGYLYYGNGGSFIPQTIERALEHTGPQRHYRNECLCKGMVHFNMIDTVGRGIKKIFMEQQKRFFPMPDYEIDNENRSVGVTIYGKVIDEKYTNLLKSSSKISLKDCILLDAIQKHRKLPDESIRNLKNKKLIEGRKNNYTISLKVAKLTHQLGKYAREKGLDSKELIPLLMSLAQKAGADGFKRMDAVEAVEHLLPANKSRQQQIRFVGDLLRGMAKDGLIETNGKFWFIKLQTGK